MNATKRRDLRNAALILDAAAERIARGKNTQCCYAITDAVAHWRGVRQLEMAEQRATHEARCTAHELLECYFAPWIGRPGWGATWWNRTRAPYTFQDREDRIVALTLLAHIARSMLL